MPDQEKKPRNLSFHKLIPNMITLTAMAAGMTAIKFAIVGKWEWAVMSIVIAAFLDAFDGAAARILKAQSKLGSELDSLSDFLCFGVSPAIVVFLWATHDAGRIGWIMALLFAMGVALRLARFNVAKEEEKTDDPLSKYFTGVPSPTGAGLAILPMIVSFQLEEGGVYDLIRHPYAAGGWLVIVAGMMVSHIPTFSSKQLRVPRKMAVPALAVFGILLAGLINAPWPTLTLMGVVYLLSMPWSMHHYAEKKKALAAGIRDPDDIDHDE